VIQVPEDLQVRKVILDPVETRVRQETVVTLETQEPVAHKVILVRLGLKDPL
jgi:hypothetical protein